MPSFVYASIWYTTDFFAAIFLIIFWKLNYDLIYNYEVLSIVFWLTFLQIIITLLEQNIYKREKISALMPYEYLSSIFVIIISFFLLKDVSLITLLITVLSVIIITLFSVNLKNFIFPKSLKLIFIYHIGVAVKMLLVWYLLLSISNFDYFSIFSIFIFILSVIVFISKKYHKSLYLWTKEFYSYKLSSSITWVFIDLLSLFIISSMGLIIATLLWFLWLITTLLFWFFILKEKPKKKDVVLSAIVLVLISIWYYFQ